MAILLLKDQLINILRSNFTDPKSRPAASKFIFPDFPREDLKDASYPRTCILNADEPASAEAVNSTIERNEALFRIITFVKQDQPLTIAGTNYSDEYLLDWYHSEWKRILKDHWQEIAPDVVRYDRITESDPQYDAERGIIFRTLTIRITYLR